MRLETRKDRNRARAKLRERDGDNCHWCGEPMMFSIPIYSHPQLASIEHLRPRWKGGSNRMGNLVLAHLICSQRRNAEDHKPVSKRLATVLRIQDEVNFEAGRPQYRDYLIEHDIERGRQGR